MSNKSDVLNLVNVFDSLEGFYYDNRIDDENKREFFCRFVNCVEHTLVEFNKGIKDLKSIVLVLRQSFTEDKFAMILNKINVLSKFMTLEFSGCTLNYDMDCLTIETLSKFKSSRMLPEDYFSSTVKYTISKLRIDEAEIAISDPNISTNTVFVRDRFIRRELNELPWFKRNRICLGSNLELSKLVKLKGSSLRAKGILLVLRDIIKNNKLSDLINAVIVIDEDVDFNKEVKYDVVSDSKVKTFKLINA